GAMPGRLDERGGAGVATAAGFRDRLPLARAAAFFLALRPLVAACAASFITRSPGTISPSASPSGVRLALRYEIVLPSFSNTALARRRKLARAMAPRISSKASRVI